MAFTPLKWIESPETVKFAVFSFGLIFFFIIETLFPNRKWKERRTKRLKTHLILALSNSILFRFTLQTPLLLLAYLVQSQKWGILNLISLPTPLQFMISIFILDGLNYWWHRMNHEFSLLWKFHKVHHVDTELDVTTSLRFHFGELVLSTFFKGLWIGILGINVWSFIIFEILITLCAQFHHSNISLPTKLESILEKLIMTPKIHTGHHTLSEKTRDANYSTIFIFWDLWFKTLKVPTSKEMENLGLPQGRSDDLSFRSIYLGPFTKDY